MANIDVIMPQMGESITEGTLVKWLKKEGDAVKRDEPLFEISTEKVDVEIPAPTGGTLAAIKVKEGDTVPVNTVVAVIARAGDEAAAAASPAPERPASAPAGAGAPGGAGAAQAPAQGGAKAVPVPAKPQATRPQAAPGPVTQAPAASKGAAAARPPAATAEAAADAARATGGDVVRLDEARRRPAPAPAEARAAEAPASVEERRRTRSSPLVRKIAREHGVDITGIAGTGISGRVTRDDILAYLDGPGGEREATAAGPRAAAASAAAGAAPARAEGAARPLAARVEPMSVMRKRIAEHMVASRKTSAHVSTVFEMEMSRVHALREKHKASFEDKHGVKLTYTALIAAAVVRALGEFPVLNASIDGDSVVYHGSVNLGIAVALDWGLIVPVVKRAEEKNVLGLQRAITDLAERARARKLQPDEVQGGTFTITNPGIYGGLFGTPIINQPQVAILGLGAIEKRPVVIEDAIAIRPMAYFALSFDHRLIDGAVADQFMAFLKKALLTLDDIA